MRWSGARLQLLLAALVVLLATAASGRAHYFCRMQVEAVEDCCCPSDVQNEQRPEAKAPSCCERIVAHEATLVAATGDEAAPLAHAALAVLLPQLEPAAPPFRALSSQPMQARPALFV